MKAGSKNYFLAYFSVFSKFYLSCANRKKLLLGCKNYPMLLLISNGTGLAPKTRKQLTLLKKETPYCPPNRECSWNASLSPTMWSVPTAPTSQEFISADLSFFVGLKIFRHVRAISGTVGYRMKFPYSLSAGRDGLSISSSRLVPLDCAA